MRSRFLTAGRGRWRPRRKNTGNSKKIESVGGWKKRRVFRSRGRWYASRLDKITCRVRSDPPRTRTRWIAQRKIKNGIFVIISAVPALEISQFLCFEFLSFCSSCNFRISKALRYFQRFPERFFPEIRPSTRNLKNLIWINLFFI